MRKTPNRNRKTGGSGKIKGILFCDLYVNVKASRVDLISFLPRIRTPRFVMIQSVFVSV
uniref:Uncharacterized protein n=1 Tax=Anopheles quadriannulatus TaxID=34691 RepID=A0A182XQH8_ANOQN